MLEREGQMRHNVGKDVFLADADAPTGIRRHRLERRNEPFLAPYPDPMGKGPDGQH